MPKNNSKILAIDPGTREMGIAFLDGAKLIYYGVKVIPNEKSPNDRLKEGKEIILRLINDFKPDILVVEKSFFANNRTASLLHAFINEIRAIGRKKGVKGTVRKSVCGNGRASKKELSKVIVSKYPNLKVYLS
jgi:crossover junction endodeoxyribonuclease RuvC